MSEDRSREGDVNNLTYEPSLETKIDILDIIISFLMKHEKQIDNMLQRLERSVETLSERDRNIEHDQTHRYPEGHQPNSFTLSITNPIGFENMKPIKIEFDTKTRRER